MSIREQLAEENPEALIWDGFDDALIGIARTACKPPLALYSLSKCVVVLQGQGMTAHEAHEYLEFNTLCAYMGEMTPIYTD